MKKLTVSVLALLICLNHLCFGQIKSMGLTPFVAPSGDDEKPKLKLLDDTLYVCTYTGIYKKHLQDDTDWELYAFENIPIKDFVKNGDKLLAVKQYLLSQYIENNTDSMLLLSNDNGQTFIDFTSQFFLEYGYNYFWRIVQNPENPNSILVLNRNPGIAKSNDFGISWETLNNSAFGYQNWDIAFHPLDTTSIFYTGESMIFYAGINKSSDNGETWSLFEKDNNCFHSIAFHPTNPDIIVSGGEYLFAKSTDKGETWNILPGGEMYYYKVLFDDENPTILYSSGVARNPDNPTNDTIFIYRSTDMGDTWHLWHREYIGEGGGKVFDMVKYKNKLIFYTVGCGLLELDLSTMSNNPNFTVKDQPSLTVFPNPVRDILHFETDAVITGIEIIDLSGRLHQKTYLSNYERQITVSQLNSGIYFAVFHTNELTIVKKFIIAK